MFVVDQSLKSFFSAYNDVRGRTSSFTLSEVDPGGGLVIMSFIVDVNDTVKALNVMCCRCSEDISFAAKYDSNCANQTRTSPRNAGK